jgi:hypothetical protein
LLKAEPAGETGETGAGASSGSGSVWELGRYETTAARLLPAAAEVVKAARRSSPAAS